MAIFQQCFHDEIGVLTALMGAVCVGILDEEDDDGTAKNTVFGDILALISAMVYACYSTMMKKLVQVTIVFKFSKSNYF